jgi:tetratricopeptide (TPR) repeat protein
MSPPDDILFADGPRPGARVGPYTLRRRLGVGGHASVWQAASDDGDVVALKILDAAYVGEDTVRRFERERTALEALDHENIVRVLGGGTSGAVAWLALEFVEGDDLDAVIRRWAANPDPSRFVEVERIFRAACAALQHLHDRGFVHRDVKPANILIARDGSVKLSDFGVVVTGEVSRITMTGRLVGTIAFMAPEQISEESVDARADLYGLGAVLYTMLTLQRPIEADSVAGYLARHLTAVPTPPHEIDADVPTNLERVCVRLLEKDPARRYPSAAAAAAALDQEDRGHAPVHGREEVIAQWRARLTAWRAGDGGMFLLEGPAGSGRTTLLRHLEVLAREAGLTVADPAHDERVSDLHVVDDLERVSGATKRRVMDALRHGKLVLASSAPGREPDFGTVEIDRVELGPLSRRAAIRLLRESGVPTAVATALASRLVDDAAQPGALHDQLTALVRAGWLVDDAGALKATRPLADFRDADLPVSDALRASLLARLTTLDEDARELLELLALRGRSTSATLLARAASSPPRVPIAVDRLIAAGWIQAEPGDEDLALRLANASSGALVRDTMPAERARERHLALAGALGRRRRRASTETAEHLAAGGRAEDAAPLFLAAARAHMEESQPEEALRAADLGVRTLVSATEILPGAEIERLRRGLQSIRGNALLLLGRWPEAVPALEHALEIARMQGDAAVIARSAAAFGRALYRLGRFERAAPVLEEALLHATDEAVAATARRALADIHLQEGHLDAAMSLLREALETAMNRGSRDGEARARRGIAHVLGLEGRYSEAAGQLEQADELLVPDGDPNVRIGVLIRTIELDLAGGRYAFALQRSDQLVDLLHAQQRTDRLPEALAGTAVVNRILGRTGEAVTLARRALLLARPQPARSWSGVVRAVRVLDAADAARPEDVALLRALMSDRSEVYGPAGLAHALAARVLARSDAHAARAEITAALAVPPARWSLSQIQRLADLAVAYRRLDDVQAARDAVAQIDALMPSGRCDGILLDVALLRAAIDGAPSDDALAGATRIRDGLPPRLREGFVRRPEIDKLGLPDDPGATR